MLNRNLDVVDLDGRQLAAWLDLFRPPGLDEPDWTLVFVDKAHRPEHAVRAGRGAIDAASIGLRGVHSSDLAAARLSPDGGEGVGSTPEQLRQFVITDIARWRKVVKSAGIKLE